MARLEYLVREGVQGADLNLLGMQGWELVTVLPATNMRLSRFFFKRAVPLTDADQETTT